MTLDCKDKLIPFYVSLGYACEQGNANSMNIRFPEIKSNYTSVITNDATNPNDPS